MKKIIPIIVLTLFFITTPKVFAQNATREQFSKVFNDYRDKYDSYVKIHDQYVLSKKEYDQYGTLTSKENLQNVMQKMLIARDDVLVYYYKILISKMDDSLVTMSADRKSEYVNKLNVEISWIHDHESQYRQGDSLENLSTRSKEVSDRVDGYQGNLYQNLYYIARGKFDTYNDRYGALYNDLVTLTDHIKNESRDAYKLSDQKISTIDRWFSEIGLKGEEMDKTLELADKQIGTAQGRNSLGVYYGSVKTLNKAMSSFIDRILETKEIINEIKVSDK